MRKKNLYRVEDLKPLEGYLEQKVIDLVRIIQRDEIWKAPISISNDGVIMDGHHRFETAKRLGLKYVPVKIFDYDNVEVFSLRGDVEVTKDIIKNNQLTGVLFPPKTAKHIFTEENAVSTAISLSELK